MNGYERIKAALRGERPDKTPVMLHNFMMAAAEYGISMEQYRESPKMIAETFIDAIDRYQYDGILIDIDTVTLAGAVGVPVDFPRFDPARTHQGNLTSLDDVDRLKHPAIENYKYIQIWLEAVSILKDHFKDELYIRGNCDQAPFSLASMMRGTQNWMLDLMMEEEDKIFRLLDYCLEASSQFIRLMSQTGCHMVSNGDSPAGPEMISPEMYQKYALPYEKRLVEVAHSMGVDYTLHICGNTELILDDMLTTGADALELDYKTDCKRIVASFGTTTFIGNIDPSGILAMGSVADVERATRELLRQCSGMNRFILNAGCAIPPNTPPANLSAMIRTAREEGIV